MLRASSNLCEAEGARRTWAERLREAETRLDPVMGLLHAKRTLFVTSGAVEALEALIVGLHHDLDFGIVESSRVSPGEDEGLTRIGFACLNVGSLSFSGEEQAQPCQAGRVSVMTSGTTGAARAVEHNWQTLNTMSRVRERGEQVWFVPYQPGTYAWYQMMCLGLFNAGQHLFCASPVDPIASFSQAFEAGVTAVSSTPTFWRYAFLNLGEETLRAAEVETISLGGEIVDQAILDKLKATFPRASIRHIYASSEAGAAIVVSDGKAGFPVNRLDPEGAGPVRLKVEDGRLYVRSGYTTAAAAGAGAEWIDSGDRVDVRGDRVYFLGRDGGAMINVGGMKAYPAEIEAQLMKHPNVAWVQVFARNAPLVGALPAARVVLRSPSADLAESESELAAFARGCLPEHAVPRFWEFRQDIPMGSSLKS